MKSLSLCIEKKLRGHRGCDCMDVQLPMQSVPISTNIARSNPAHGEAYSVQHYVIKFVKFAVSHLFSRVSATN